MRPWISLTRWMRLGAAAAVCLIAAWPIRADDAAKGQPAAIQATQPAKTAEPAPAAAPAAEAPKPPQVAPAPVRLEPPTPGDPLEKELKEETAKLQKMEAELKAVESLPLPSAAAPVVKAPAVNPAADPKDIPKEPVNGLEEDYANALYAVGKYDLARAVYQKIIESKPKADVLAWARFQVGNCARHSDDFPAAGAAYEALMTASPTSPWADEAAWWSGEVKWRILWDQSTK